MKILIADIDSEIIEDVGFTLNKFQPDWYLSIIDSGSQCLDIVKNGECPDAVILGMQLSDMSGLDLIQQLHDDSDVPVIVLSPDKDIQTLIKAFDAGANDYIVKPFNKQIFIARLKALIRRRMWDIRGKEGYLRNGNNHQVECQSLSGESEN
jgi:DNA-binding response OmpR family regulator